MGEQDSIHMEQKGKGTAAPQVQEGLHPKSSKRLKQMSVRKEAMLFLLLKGQLQGHTTMLVTRQERGERGK